MQETSNHFKASVALDNSAAGAFLFPPLFFPSPASIERTPATNATDTTVGEGTHFSEINLGGAL